MPPLSLVGPDTGSRCSHCRRHGHPPGPATPSQALSRDGRARPSCTRSAATQRAARLLRPSFLLLLSLCALLVQPARALSLSGKDAARTRVRKELLWKRDPAKNAALNSALHPQQQCQEPRDQQQAAVPPPYNPRQLDRLFSSHQFLLPLRDLKRGLAYQGTLGRLRLKLHGLLASGASPRFKAGVVGGSPSAGHGASQAGVTDYFSVFASWMKAAFPNATLNFRNGAIPATPSRYMALCLHSHMDSDVNLVFIEFNANDASSTNDRVDGNSVVMPMERLIRNALALPGRPAVVLVQVPPFGQAQSKDDRFVGSTVRPYYSTTEDVEGALCQYYDISCISMRGAVYHLAEVERREGFKWRNLFFDVHPGDAGYKVLADLAVYLMQEATLDLLAEPLGPEDRAAAEEPLPEPMYAGNVPPASTQCSVGLALEKMAVSASGFEMVNEGTEHSPKWGYVGTRPGAFLELEVSTLDAAAARNINSKPAASEAAAAAEGVDQQPTVAVHLLYLKSYVLMGQAAVSCISGCTCEPQLVNALHADHTSTVFIHSFFVSPSDACVLRVEVVQDTLSSDQSHKFKVTGIVLGAAGAVGLSGAKGAHKGQFWMYSNPQYDIVRQHS